MSILIKDLDMPKSCYSCILDEHICELWRAVGDILHKRHHDCPLVEIDDELFQKAENAYVFQQIRSRERSE